MMSFRSPLRPFIRGHLLRAEAEAKVALRVVPLRVVIRSTLPLRVSSASFKAHEALAY
jgi:hypothetical protein